ncbi:hypothetical protein ACIPQA_25890 [Streptomyces sp. NPDC090109]|uniref:hypothetical protein n=1 Tax=Streptomyces sp. NPDC090109 TaxID=3365948 RepID=UPI00380D4EB6
MDPHRDLVARHAPVSHGLLRPSARPEDIAAETRAARGLLEAARRGSDPAPVTEADLAAWAVRSSAAGALREFLLLPLPDAAVTILSRWLSVHWRDDLAEDLAG